MVKRWFLYLLTLAGCVGFYAAYQGWMAWFLLNLVGCLPLFSMAVSLVPILLVRPAPKVPGAVTRQQPVRLGVQIRSPLPLPPCRCRFRVTYTLTGETMMLSAGEQLPTDHCGEIRCENTAFAVFDFLNLIALPRKRLEPIRVLVRPEPIAVPLPRDLDRFLAQAWKPKYGGGFAENHELRLYRPGDGLNQVHWKLTAKTGKLMIREPMEPQMGRVLLTLDLTGQPKVLDEKLGKLLFLSKHLLSLGLKHEIMAHTGSGLLTLPVPGEPALYEAVDTLLSVPGAATDAVQAVPVYASWQYHIGGDRP